MQGSDDIDHWLAAGSEDRKDPQCRLQLSAMLDGELAPDEARFLLRRLQHDRKLADCWERWQIYGDLLRGSAPNVLPIDFSRQVMAALDTRGRVEADVSQSGPPKDAAIVSAAVVPSVRRRRRGAIGMAALAASAATLALFTSWLGGSPEDGLGETAIAPTALVSVTPAVVPSSRAQNVGQRLADTALASDDSARGEVLRRPDPFQVQIEQPVVPRPWPRAVPSMGGGRGIFTVDHALPAAGAALSMPGAFESESAF